MNIWKVILSTLVIFTAGLFTGAIVNNLGHHAEGRVHRLSFRETFKKPATPAAAATNHEPTRLTLPAFNRFAGKNAGKEFLDRLDRELKLTAEQKQQAEKILEASQQRSKEIWERIAPDLREEMKHSREQLREIFTPEQTACFDNLMKPAPKLPKDAAPASQPPAAP